MENRHKVCIDRILPRDLMRLQPTKRMRNGGMRAVAPIGKTWMNGSTLRVRFVGGTPTEQTVARQQAEWWAEVANLKFDFNDALNAEIRIAFDRNDGAWSYVGTDCRGIPLNEPTMNLGFLDGGTAGHEFGHAIGLAHEHQNPAGGIQWNEAVVIREAAKSPNFWDEATTRHNILRKYSAAQVNGTSFDPDSIMLYFFPASWTLNGIGTKANEILSAMDKAFAAGAKMYPKARGYGFYRRRATRECQAPRAGVDREGGRRRSVSVYGCGGRAICDRHAGPDGCGDEALRAGQRDIIDCGR
jgi:hypothetical protein